MANRFIELFESGRLRDATGLRRAFRSLAKRAHPDMRRSGDRAVAGELAPDSSEEASTAFIALRAEYEEALAFLQVDGEREKKPATHTDRSDGAPPKPASTRHVLPFDRRAFYESFEDLIARGFPHPPTAPYPARLYTMSRNRTLAYLAGRDEVFPEARALAAFLDFESAYQNLPSRGGFLAVDTEARRLLFYLLSNLLGYHRSGFRHLASIARNFMPQTEPLLVAQGAEGALPFLGILIADLEGGPAMTDS